MSLESLKFDRFLFRNKNGNPNTPMQGITSDVPDGASYDTSTGGGSAGGINADNGGIAGQPGGIIAQMYLRSSNGPDRVEINPNDSFIAYNNDIPVVVIDKNGIDTPSITKKGFAQPTMIGTGFVNAAGTPGGVFPTGWTVTNLSAGRYEITHNLNTLDYVVLLTPLAATTREFSVESQALNTFITRFYTNPGATLINTDHTFLVLTNP